jgi:hypothetical protein
MRPIYGDGRRQYVVDNKGFKVYGVWMIWRSLLFARE